MSEIPKTVTREQIVAACAALGLEARDIVEMRVTNSEVYVTTIVKVGDAAVAGSVVGVLKTAATITVGKPYEWGSLPGCTSAAEMIATAEALDIESSPLAKLDVEGDR